MQHISIRDLKRRLSAVIAEAEAGTTILITRHNRAVARLSPAGIPNVHVGKHFGLARLKPLLKASARGRYLEVLLDDRQGDPR